MGQKVNPHGFRVGVINGWETQWYANKKDFGKFLLEDFKIREFIKKKYYACSISRITIARLTGAKIVINIYTARPGMLIGTKGAGVEEMKRLVSKLAPGKTVSLNIIEIKRPDADATLLAESVAAQLEKRASWRRTMKQVLSRAMKAGVKGVKVNVAGRLDGAEIAREEHYSEGSIPLQTLRADIDYGVATAHTTFGVIGIKVWIYKGEVLGVSRKEDKTNVNA